MALYLGFKAIKNLKRNKINKWTKVVAFYRGSVIDDYELYIIGEKLER